MDDGDREHLTALLDRLDVVTAFLRGRYHDAGLAFELSRLSDDIQLEHERLRREFADARGWQSNPRSTFSLHKLATGRRARTPHDPLADHDADVPVCDVLDRFREWRTGPNGRTGAWPVGVVVHTKASPADIDAFAKRVGLACEPLPWSWHDPRHYNSALLVHPDPSRRPAGGRPPRVSGAPHERSASHASRATRGCSERDTGGRQVRRNRTPT